MRQLNGNGFAPQPMLRGQEETGSAAPVFRFEVVRSVRLHPRLALGVAATVFLLIVGYALTRRPVYEAESLTYVEPLTTKVLNDGSPGYFDPSRYDSYIEQQIQTAQRPDILQAAIEKLPPGVWRYPGESMPAAVARLVGSLQVKRVDTSYQLSISATGADPVGVAAVVNAVTEAYLQQGSKDEHAISDGRIQLLDQERQRIENELTQAQAEQTSLSASLGVASPTGTSANPYDMQLAGIRGELVAAEEAHDVAAAQLESMSAPGGLQSPAMTAAADELIAGDAGLSSMKATIDQRRANLQSQMAGLTPSNPVYKQDQDEIASVDRDLDAMTAQLRVKAQRRLQDKLSGDLQRTGDVEAKLNAQLARATAQATGAAPKLQRATDLTADIARLQGSLASVDDALRALELETHGPGMAHLSMAATAPSAPETSGRGKLLLAAFPLALLAGLGAAVFARKRDPRAYTGQDVQRTLGFPPMGVMPVDDEVSDAVVEEYLLRLAAGVERAYRADGARSFVFTAVSASTNIEGLVRALQHKLTALGFTAAAMDVNGVLRPEQEHSLELRLDRAGREGFVASQLERMKREHDLLLIEAQPLLGSAESEYAVSSTDATVLVAESGVTTDKELKDAAALLQRLHARGVAVVLQQVHLSFAGPEFRAAVEHLEMHSYGVAPGVLEKGPSSTRGETAAARRRIKEQKELVSSAAKRPRAAAYRVDEFPGFGLKGSGEKSMTGRKAAAAARETAAEETMRLRLEQVTMSARNQPQPVEAALQERQAAERDGSQRTKMQQPGRGLESNKPRVETGLPVQARTVPMAPEESAMRSKDDKTAKRNILERVFKRYHESPVSIVPDEDEDEDVALPPAATAVEASAPVVSVPVIAAGKSRSERRAETAAETELAARAESALAVAASFAQAAEESQTAAAAEVALPVEAVAAPVAQEEVRETAASANEPTVLIFAERPRTASVPASARKTKIETARAGHATAATAERPARPAPTMRQWEFRQARKMRELSAAGAAAAARPAEDALGSRRSPRPGLVSATGKRVLIEDAAATHERSVAQPSHQPQLVRTWSESEAQTEPTQPARRWGMLSRFDQRFSEREMELLEGREADDERAMGTYGRGSRRG